MQRLKLSLERRLPMLGVGDASRCLGRLLVLFGCYAAAATTIYLSSGLGRVAPRIDSVAGFIALAAGFFVLPSLLEELLWRWTLIASDRLGRVNRRSAASVLASSVVFTAAHPIAAWLFVPHAREVFLRPAFLAIVFLLGLTTGVSYVWSKSIWPPVFIHWVTVLAWKFLLGGPFVLLGA